MGRRTYSQELVSRVVGKMEGGVKVADIADKYQISKMTLYKWKKEFEERREKVLKTLDVSSPDKSAEQSYIDTLKQENERLKKTVARLLLYVEMTDGTGDASKTL